MRKFFIATLTALTVMTVTNPSDAAGRSNPLLEPSPLPFGAVPFDKITPEDYEQAILEGIRLQKQEIDAIVNQRSTPTFENTLVALDRSGRQLASATLALGNLEHALGDTILQNVLMRVTPALSEHETSIVLNEPLFARVKEVYERMDERPDLTDEDRRLITESYEDFLHAGANLTGADREKYRKLNAELSDLTLKFGQNVSNDMKNPARRLWLTADQLSGIPESIVTAARAEAKEVLEAEGKTDDGTLYLFTMFMPSYSPFLKYADNRDLREKIYRMYNSRNAGGEYDNMQILKDIANVRLEIARLMGYDSYADYQLRRTMAHTPANVYDLLNQLNESYTPAMKEELKEIEEFARLTEGPDYKLMPWDYSYWSDKLKNSKYAFNDEDMRPYFELNNTIKGVFGLAEKLYGYKFKENKTLPVYHPDVRAYEVYEDNGKILGILYADFFYRPGKAPGAWMTEFRTESKDDNGVKSLPLISIVTNFSKPVGNDAVLLTPYEVETFLHEFGHALHGLSAEAKYISLSGTNVYHDFVELFSQFNENFLPQKKFLDSFAKHYKTGKKMPQELIDKFTRSHQYGAGYACMRQLNFGFLDMAFHTIKEPLRASADVAEFEKNAQNPVRIFDVVENCYAAPAFGHIFSGGYAAGYYGYKWSEVLDADAFEAFLENGIFDKKTAAGFRKMLQAGGTDDPMKLYVGFRGKNPTIDALLKRDGIKK